MPDNVTPIETTSQEVGHVPIHYADLSSATIQVVRNAMDAAYLLKSHKRTLGMISRIHERDAMLVSEGENALLDIATDDIGEDFDEFDEEID